MVSVAELQENGFKCFTHVESSEKLTRSPHMPAFERIFEKLGDKSVLTNGIARLEEAMWVELHRRTPYLTQLANLWNWTPTKDIRNGQTGDFKKHFDPNSEFKIDPTRKTQTRFKGILSTVLRKTESENGFGDVSYAWGVGAEAFLSNLKARRPFKDYSASVSDHGEYTHRIQWWIVCNDILPKSGVNAQYYAECANWRCELNKSGKLRQVYLWDYLFDSATNTTGFNDEESMGRSPIKVFELCRSADPYPMLAAFLNYRVQKATAFGYQVMSEPSAEKLSSNLAKMDIPPGVLERAARRFLNQSFGSLNRELQAKVYEEILERGFTDHSVEV